MVLDIRTLIVHFILSNLLVAALFGIAFRGRHDRVTLLWIASLLVQSLAWVLVSLRGRTPDFICIVLAGGLLSLNYAMLTNALADFFRMPIRHAWPYWPVPLAFAAFGWWVEDISARHIAGGLIFGAQQLMAAILIFTRSDHWSGLRAVIGVSAVATGTMFLARAATVMVDPLAIPRLPETSPFQTASFLVGSVTRLIFSFGFLLLIEARRNDEITRLATLDSLTETYNRRTFFELAERELARCHRKHHPLALMILDLDHFKQINDTHGHLLGDAVLRQVKSVADTCLRRQDVFGRFGGEEFCVLAPESDRSGALALAERLRREIADSAIVLPDGGVLRATVSIGVAAAGHEELPISIDTMLARADRGLYRAKRDGRNRVAAI